MYFFLNCMKFRFRDDLGKMSLDLSPFTALYYSAKS